MAVARRGMPRPSLGLVDDQALQTYVKRVGTLMAAKSERPILPWNFGVVDDPTPNAFALPGGFIYVTRGLMGLMDSEAELASVLGHEIGHVTARHSVSMMSRAQLAQLGLGLGSVLLPDLQPAARRLVPGSNSCFSATAAMPNGRPTTWGSATPGHRDMTWTKWRMCSWRSSVPPRSKNRVRCRPGSQAIRRPASGSSAVKERIAAAGPQSGAPRRARRVFQRDRRSRVWRQPPSRLLP